MLTEVYAKRKFYDNFHYYFDRNKFLNIYFSFNFIELLKTLSSIPRGFVEKYKEFFIQNYSINLFLYDLDNKFIKNINIKEKFNLFEDVDLDTYNAVVDSSDLKGKYKIVGVLNFNQSFYDYVLIKSREITASVEDKNYFNKLKIILNESKFSYTNSKAQIGSKYSFESGEIDFNTASFYASNLYEIYKRKIKIETYSRFIEKLSLEKGVEYDGNIPLTKYIAAKQKEYEEINLNFNLIEKTGDRSSYQNLLMAVLQDVESPFNYKEFSSLQNIYVVDGSKERKKTQSIQTYEKLNDNLQSLVCDNNIFSQTRESVLRDFKDSEVLLLATYINNVKDLEIDNFWREDFTLIPIYIIDIMTNYNVYFLESINKNSMSDNWKLLTREEIQNLKSGKYLCKIIPTQQYINKFLIENYFVLVK